MSPEHLRAWRKGIGLTQHELGQALGVTKTTVCRWETGIRAIPAFLSLALEAVEFYASKRVPATSKGAR